MEECIAFVIRVKRISKLGITLAATSNQSTLQNVPLKCRFFQEPQGVTSQEMAFFIESAIFPSVSNTSTNET
jgi:hypothetical protein